MYSFWIKCANVNIVVYGNLMVECNQQVRGLLKKQVQGLLKNNVDFCSQMPPGLRIA